MNINLTPDDVNMLIKSLACYSQQLRSDCDDSVSKASRDSMYSESLACLDLADLLDHELKNLNVEQKQESQEEQPKQATARAVCPYEDWSPNDPRNW